MSIRERLDAKRAEVLGAAARHGARNVRLIGSNELERRGAEVGYVKTGEGFEVDFLARHPAAAAELIQVCADVSAPQTLTREVRALKAASAEHPRARRRLLVVDRDALARVGAVDAQVQPAYEWLLAHQQSL